MDDERLSELRKDASALRRTAAWALIEAERKEEIARQIEAVFGKPDLKREKAS